MGGERTERRRPSAAEATGWLPDSWTTLLAAAIGLGIALGVAAVRVQAGPDMLDLRIYLGASQVLGEGGPLYGYEDGATGLGYTYPPLLAVVLLPITHLGIDLVQYLWAAGTAAAWFAVLWRLNGGGRGGELVERHQLWWLWVASLLTTPLFHTLHLGQINVWLWLLIATDLIVASRGGRSAGVRSGVAGAVKLVPLALIPLYAGAGRLRAAVGAVAGFVGATAAAAVVAPEETRRFATDVVFSTDRVGQLGDPLNTSLLGLIHRVGLDGRPATIAWLAASAAVLAVGCVGLRRALDRGAVVSAVLVCGSVMGLASPISWRHHLVFLTVAGLLALPVVLHRRSGWGTVVLVTAWLVLVDPGELGSPVIGSTIVLAAMGACVVGGTRLAALERRLRGGRSDEDEVADLSPARSRAR